MPRSDVRRGRLSQTLSYGLYRMENNIQLQAKNRSDSTYLQRVTKLIYVYMNTRTASEVYLILDEYRA